MERRVGGKKEQVTNIHRKQTVLALYIDIDLTDNI